MGGSIKEKQIYQEMQFEKSNQFDRIQWLVTEAKGNVIDECESGFVEKCSDDDLCDSVESLSSSELLDDATSSSSSDIMSQDGPLYELSELMTHLPIKRSLSKYYQGKSESFGSLANLRSFEDLAKKGITQRSKRSMKSPYRRCGQSECQQMLSPKGTIVKKKKRSSSSIATSSLFFLQ